MKFFMYDFSWMINLSEFFHKWRNMVKFYQEFIFGIIERINMRMQISIFCHFFHHKKEFDVVLIHGIWMMCFINGTFQISSSRKYNYMQHCVIHQNNIKFYFLITKLDKMLKFAFWYTLHHVSSLMEKLRQISHLVACLILQNQQVWSL